MKVSGVFVATGPGEAELLRASLPALRAQVDELVVIANGPRSRPGNFAGDAAIFTDDLADGVRRALADRAQLSAAGLQRAKRYSWRETARITADVYRSVLRS